MAGQLSLLVPYLGCGNETVRCGIVHILGALVAEVFSNAVSVPAFSTYTFPVSIVHILGALVAEVFSNAVSVLPVSTHTFPVKFVSDNVLLCTRS